MNIFSYNLTSTI